MIKSFAPLKIQFTLKGGSTMDYKIIEKEVFTVLGKARRFDFDCAFNEIPKFWGEHMQSADKKVCGVYGVCIEDEKDEGFKYLIADEYVLDSEIPDGYEVCEIPQLTWAVFACHGAVPKSLQEVNTKIFLNGYQIMIHTKLLSIIILKCIHRVRTIHEAIMMKIIIQKFGFR